MQQHFYIMIEQSPDSSFIHAVNADNFKPMVLDNSKQGPVLVNFWSRKAGPSLRQYPVLDKLIYDFRGKVLLVNVDIDTDYKITNEYGITSVPTLKLFVDEHVVATRHGFQSEEELKELLQQYIVRPSDKILANAIHLYSQGDCTKAYEVITDAIMEDPDNPRLPLALCKILKYEKRYIEANKILSSLPVEMRQNEDIIKFRNLIDFHIISNGVENVEVLTERLTQFPDNLSTRKQLSAWYVVENNFEMAISELIRIIEIDKNYDEKYPKTALLKIFAILGKEHELVNQYRYILKQYTF